MGDRARLLGVRPLVLFSAALTLVSCLALVFGVGVVRALGLVGLFSSVGVLAPTLVIFRNTVRRISSGRGLVPGDPHRLEGVDVEAANEDDG